MKHSKLNSLIILLVTILVLYLIMKDNFNEIMEVLGSVKVPWLLLGILFFFLYFLFDQLAIYAISKRYNKNISFKFILYLGTITKFFNGITPLSTGGQPMQVYEFYKKGIPASKGTNIVIQNYFMFQIALVGLGVVAVILNKIFNLFKYVPVLKQLTILGFVLNIIILFVLLLAAYSEEFIKGCAKGIINFLAKIKVVKNKKKQLDKWDKTLSEYHQGAMVLIHHKKTFIFGTICQTLSLVAYYIMPIFLAYSINCASHLNVLNTLAAGAYIYLMGCYVPIPGASGGMEYAFMGFFGNFIKGYKLSALLVLWRFITYYAPTIIGAIVFNIGNTSKKSEDEINEILAKSE